MSCIAFSARTVELRGGNRKPFTLCMHDETLRSARAMSKLLLESPDFKLYDTIAMRHACIEAMLLGVHKAKSQVEIYNVGSEDQIEVTTIAQIVIDEMGLKKVKLAFTGGVNGGRGWIGDVKNMLLDISKIKSLGWNPDLNSKQAIRKATKQLLRES